MSVRKNVCPPSVVPFLPIKWIIVESTMFKILQMLSCLLIEKSLSLMPLFCMKSSINILAFYLVSNFMQKNRVKGNNPCTPQPLILVCYLCLSFSNGKFTLVMFSNPTHPFPTRANAQRQYIYIKKNICKQIQKKSVKNINMRTRLGNQKPYEAMHCIYDLQTKSMVQEPDGFANFLRLKGLANGNFPHMLLAVANGIRMDTFTWPKHFKEIILKEIKWKSKSSREKLKLKNCKIKQSDL